MLAFILRRLGTMVLTMLCLTMVVFFMVNLEPNLRKLAISQLDMRSSDEHIESWLVKNGYRQNFFVRYGQWLGVVPEAAEHRSGDGQRRAALQLLQRTRRAPLSAAYCRAISAARPSSRRRFRQSSSRRLRATGMLMFWVMVTMVPISLLIGILAGMREGTRTDRTLSVASIATTATPEYVSGVIFTVIFASWLGWLNGSAASATGQGLTFYNFTLPVMTMAIYGIGYIARMTRASMVEVMTQQYIRTARLKGLSFSSVVVKHALRNALIAPFTVIMLQFPWLLTGVVIVETMFRYQGFGFTLVEAAGNNDIDLLLGCSLVSVFIVLFTQLISDIGYAYLNPRIRVQ